MNTNNLAFPYKDKEKVCKTHISVKSADYNKAIKIIRAHFHKSDYYTAEAVGQIVEQGTIGAIANVLVRAFHNETEIACIVDLREARRLSTKKLLERAFKLLKYWEKVIIFFCYSKGNGSFPIAQERIFDGDPKKKIDLYSLNLTTGIIDYIPRPKKRSRGVVDV